MTLTVFDEDVGKDDKVGSNVIKLSSLCVNGGLDEWFQVQHKGKNCGSVHLKGHWTPHGAGVVIGGKPITVTVTQ